MQTYRSVPRFARGMALALATLTMLMVLAPAMHAGGRVGVHTSAFAREHANSPVAWLPWGDEAFRRAREQSKPLYVTIGAFTSELSRAMARQTFGNAETARFLNEHFVCVLVDREEHPGLAALYRTYLRTAKQLDGWPLNVWLTPELRPIEGATYLPPSEEWGKPGFMVVARRVADAWKRDPEALRQQADDAIALVASAAESTAPALLASDEAKALLSESAAAWQEQYDAANGGFGAGPKWPEPELLRFLLREPAHRERALKTLSAMIDSPLRDPLDGGFFRYASDAAWRQPALQKTLHDQARIALALLDAARIGKHPRFATAARGALDFVLTHLRGSAGGYVAAHDATGEQNATYHLWTMDELRAALGAREAAEAARALGVTAEGNLPADAYGGAGAKRNVLFRPLQPAEPAAHAQVIAKLLARRAQRAGLRVDPVATAGAHGLLLTALARGASELREPRFEAAARELASFIGGLRFGSGTLRRLPGRDFAAAPEDYAFVIAGLTAYHRTSGSQDAGELAQALGSLADVEFFDAATGRYFGSARKLEPGIWARVHVPAPSAGEPPGVESVMVLARGHLVPSHESTASELSRRLAALAAEARNAGAAPRGDVLLALSEGAGR